MKTKRTIPDLTVGVDLGDRKSAVCRLQLRFRRTLSRQLTNPPQLRLRCRRR
jgi:hypothetical protein